MNKKLMIVMLVVGASALYVRFQVVGMEEGDGLEQERQRLERERAAVEVPGNVEQDTEGFYGFYKPKDETDEEAKNEALRLNMEHDNFPEEMRESVLSYVPLPPKVMAFLCHKLCIPNSVRTLRGNIFVDSVAFSPDGRLLATGSVDRTVGIWDIASGNRVQTLQHADSVYSVAFSPDGRLLVTGCADGTAGIWDVASGQRLQTLQCGQWVRSVAFSPDGKLLATGTWKGKTAEIWDVASGNRLQILRHGNLVSSVSFSSDGKLLAIGFGDTRPEIWDVASGDRLQILQHGNWVYSVAFSPDGKLLATGSGNNRTAIIWNVEGGNRLKTLQCDSRWVSSVAFSPDGKLLATGSFDKAAGIWNVATGRRLQTLQCGGNVSSVSFSPDGKLLATAGGSNVFLWNVECFQTLERSIISTSAQYELMKAFDLTLENERNGTVRIVRKINATPEQWATFETLPANIQTALRPLIRNEKDQKKVADYWHSKQKAAAAPAEQAASLGKEEEESAASEPSGEETSAKEAADRYLDVGHSGIG